nr:DNA-3-methyladenine glycosylase 1-like [Ipomoea batatas]
MDDKSLFTMLTMVNGIGSWSVHMFMIFSLHRPDVLPIHDLGIRKGVQMLNELEDLPRPSQMDQLCEKWRPYRSVAAWYIWRFVEAKNTNSNTNVVSLLVLNEPYFDANYIIGSSWAISLGSIHFLLVLHNWRLVIELGPSAFFAIIAQLFVLKFSNGRY